MTTPSKFISEGVGSMKIKLNVNEDAFNEAFLPALWDESRIQLFRGSGSSGKSYFKAQDSILKLLGNPHRNYLYVRKTFKTHRTTTLATLKKVARQFQIADYLSITGNPMMITNKLYKNAVYFVGLDNLDKILSTDFETGVLTNIVYEEASEGDEESFHQLMIRQRGEAPVPKQIALIFNPISKKNWIYKKFYDKGSRDNIGLDVFDLLTTYRDNKFRGDEVDRDMEFLRLKMPEYYQVFGLGEWGEPLEGLRFKRQHYGEYDSIPDDARGVIYCDPNLSKKQKGDTTAIFKILFSPSTQNYYVAKAICRSFSQSNELLQELFNIRGLDDRARPIGFDGNVSQESHWTNHVRSYSRELGQPVPIIDYKHYRVDELSKNAEIVWNENRILFPKNFRNTDDGERIMNQIFAFAGKKNSKSNDDAPDALICAIEYLYERNFVKTRSIPDSVKKLLI